MIPLMGDVFDVDLDLVDLFYSEKKIRGTGFFLGWERPSEYYFGIFSSYWLFREFVIMSCMTLLQ